MNYDNSVGVGPAGGGQAGLHMINYGNQRQSRNSENTGVILGRNVIHGDSIVNVPNINGRPMSAFIFKLTPANLALRIFKTDEGKCKVSRLDPNGIQRPNKGETVVLKKDPSRHVKAQVANPKGKARLHSDLVNLSIPSGSMGASVIDQGVSGLGESLGVFGVTSVADPDFSMANI